MKSLRVLAILLVAVLLLCACQGKKQEKQTLADPNGIWLLDDAEYYIIDAQKVYKISKEELLQTYTDAMEQTLLQQGIDAYWSLTPEMLTVEPTLQEVGEMTGESSVRVDGGKIELSERTLSFYKGKTKCSFKRLSKETTFSGQWTEDLFALARQNMVVKTEVLLPTLDEYRQYLYEKAPSADTWLEVERDDGASMISDTGSALKHNGALTKTDHMVSYSQGFTRLGTGSFSVEYDGTKIIVRDSNYRDLRTIVSYAAPVLEALPYNIGVERFLAVYKQQRVINGGQFTFDYMENGVTYSISRIATGRETVLSIALPTELTVPSVPVERTEPPYETGFGTQATTGLRCDQVYLHYFIFDNYPVENYMLFDESGKLYMLTNFGLEYELFTDKEIGTYEINGDEITIYFESLSVFDETEQELEVITVVMRYDPQSKTLVQLSDRGISWKQKPGYKATLKETQYYSSKAMRSFFD